MQLRCAHVAAVPARGPLAVARLPGPVVIQVRSVHLCRLEEVLSKSRTYCVVALATVTFTLLLTGHN